MEYIGFKSESNAFWHRKNNGGWLFIASDRSEYIWFTLKFTPTLILKHCVTQGLSGILTCARTRDEAVRQIAA